MNYKPDKSARTGCGLSFRSCADLAGRRRAQFFGIASLDEARAYLAHPHLGPRLVSCTQTVLDLRGRSLNAIFGSPDKHEISLVDVALRRAAGDTTSVFAEALSRYCDGIADERTVALLP